MLNRKFLAAMMLFAWVGCGSDVVENTDEGIQGDSNVEDVLEPIDANLPDGAICSPGTGRCSGNNWLVCNDEGTNYDVIPCDGACDNETGCLGDTACTPLQTRCNQDGKMQVCLPDGSEWSEATDCPDEGQTCIAGACISSSCMPGATQCQGNTLLICNDESGTWLSEVCGPKAICFKGDCVECVTDDQCARGSKCLDEHCQPVPLSILTADLPEGQINIAYTASMAAMGGQPDYEWSVASGAMPSGITLGRDGAIAGTPTAAGTFTVTIAVTDSVDAVVQKPYEIVIHEEGLSIVSKSPLPDAEEGTDYSFQFKALGGVPPYGWMLTSGALPKGLSITSDGMLSGIPEEHGDFTFTMRAIDVGEPLSYDTREFKLHVAIAPLVIYGDQEINLILAKAIILPLITTGLGLPYNQQLLAKGGVKPYTWSESSMSSLLQMLIPKSGIPEGLTLSDSGVLSGRVTNVDAAVKLDLSMLGLDYVLEGFFFFAEVKDSQSPADSDSALFLIPTVPIDIGGLGGLGGLGL